MIILQRETLESYCKLIERFVARVTALPLGVIILFAAVELASWFVNKRLDADALLIRTSLPSTPPERPVNVAVLTPL